MAQTVESQRLTADRPEQLQQVGENSGHPNEQPVSPEKLSQKQADQAGGTGGPPIEQNAVVDVEARNSVLAKHWPPRESNLPQTEIPSSQLGLDLQQGTISPIAEPQRHRAERSRALSALPPLTLRKFLCV